MAKEENISTDDLKKQKERASREKAGYKKSLKEKEEKLKAKKVRLKKRELKEKKRIRKIINYPFNALFQASLIVGCLVFIVNFFGFDVDAMHALFSAFLVFACTYIGIGILLVAVFFVISERKKKETEEKILEEKILEEERLRKEEAEIQKEIARKADELQRLRELQSETYQNETKQRLKNAQENKSNQRFLDEEAMLANEMKKEQMNFTTAQSPEDIDLMSNEEMP